MRGRDKECDVTCKTKSGETDQTRTRATETIIEQIKSTRSRRGSIHCSSSSWLLKFRGKIFPDLPSLIYPLSHLYLPLVTPLSQTTPSTMVT
jgi:hypothetical protein